MILTGQQVQSMTGGVLVGGASRKCTGVSTDSRSIKQGELFVPLVGERFDGHDYIQQALECGACGCVSQQGYEVHVGGSVNVVVPDTLHALGELARSHIANLQARVVGITGSNGKTSTKEMAAAALAAYGPVAANRGNLNNLIGLPLTAFDMRPHHRFAVLEMGMSRAGEIARLTEIAQPRVGVITSIAAAHLEGLHSIEGVTWAKGELFAGLGADGVAVINTRDANVCRAAEGISARTVTVGTGDVDVSVEGIRRRGTTGFSATVKIRGGGRYDFRVRALGRHDVWNAALVVGILVALELDPAPGLEALYRRTGLGSRLHWKVTKSGVNVIDDTYNANPASVRAALETLRDVAGSQRRIAVLGDMLELGPGAAELHEEVGTLASDLGVEALFVAGEFAGDVARGYGEANLVRAGGSDELAPWVVDAAQPGDWVLVKGSRGARMERVVEALFAAGGEGVRS